MSDLFQDDQAAQALRRGLHDLPVPNVSPDFNSHVLTALACPAPWWQRVWQPARPIVLSAAASLSVTLLLLHWSMSLPLSPMPVAPIPIAENPMPMPSLDALLSRPNLLEFPLQVSYRAPAQHKAQLDRHPHLPRRHADSGISASLIA